MDQFEKRELITGIIFYLRTGEEGKLMKGEQYYLKRFSFLKRRDIFRTIFFGKKNFVKRVEIFLNEYS